jgi:hypothetical protein
MAPLQRTTYHDDAVNNSSSSLVVGWGDFPVALSQEDHPSLVQWTLPSCATTTTAVSSSNDDDAVTSPMATPTGSPTKASATPTSSSSSLRVVTFGWQDFPLVGESTSATTNRGLYLESSSLQLPSLSSASTTATVSTLISARKSRVRFGTAQVREYDIELGDHPLCPHYPWTLSWTYSRETKESITADNDDCGEVTFQPTRTKRTMGPLEPLQRRRRDHFQPISVADRRSRLANFLAISPSELDELEDERRQQLQQLELPCAEINHDDVEAPLSSTSSSTSTTTAGLHRTSNFVLRQNDGDGALVECRSTVATTTAMTPSCSRDNWWDGGYRCAGGGLLEMEMDETSIHDTNNTSANNRYSTTTAWQQQAHLLDMNLHIGGHSVHPGFEIQIYH